MHSTTLRNYIINDMWYEIPCVLFTLYIVINALSKHKTAFFLEYEENEGLSQTSRSCLSFMQTDCKKTSQLGHFRIFTTTRTLLTYLLLISIILLTLQQ